MADISALAREMANIAEDGKKYSEYMNKFKQALKNPKDKGNLLKGKTEKEVLKEYDDYIRFCVSEARKKTELISRELYSEGKDYISAGKAHGKSKADSTYAKKPTGLSSLFAKGPSVFKREGSKVNIDIDDDTFRRFLKSKKKKKKEIADVKDYSLYEQSQYGRLANKYFERTSTDLIKKNKDFFEPLFLAMKSSDFKVLSNTYVSMMLFSSLLAFFPFFILAIIFVKKFILLKIIVALLAGIIGSAITFGAFYMYPSTIVSSRRRYMEGELPFVIVHMAAVAGSGAQPIAMFNLILSSGEYKMLEPEIRKIINYVNLFGYNLTTSLRLVAANTPLKDFGELLNGIVTTIETGGNLKEYLNIKAQESMEKYQIKREKYIQNIATFSDIYIGISLVAPMLLFMTLSIINSPLLGGAISGISVTTIAMIGTYVAIPVMNFIALIVLGMITPK